MNRYQCRINRCSKPWYVSIGKVIACSDPVKGDGDRLVLLLGEAETRLETRPF